MIKETTKDAETRMRGAIQALEEDLAGIRTGRATPAPAPTPEPARTPEAALEELRDALARWMPRWMAETIAVPLAAQLACTPVVAAISGQVSLVAVAANMASR